MFPKRLLGTGPVQGAGGTALDKIQPDPGLRAGKTNTATSPQLQVCGAQKGI